MCRWKSGICASCTRTLFHLYVFKWWWDTHRPAPHSTPSHRKYLFALSCSAKLISISIVQMLDSNKHKLASQWNRYPPDYTMIKTGSLKNRRTTPMRRTQTPFCISAPLSDSDNPNSKSVAFIGLSCYKTGLTKHVVDDQRYLSYPSQ